MGKPFTQVAKILCAGIAAAFVNANTAQAQISLNPFTGSYTQNFNGLPSTTAGTWESGTQYFPGWFLHRTAPITTALYVGTGTNNTGGLYSYGASGSTDRALGSIASATSTVGEFAWGLLIQNNTGSTITALHISFTGEQWRSARPATPQHMLSFWYATGADPAVFNLSPKSDAGWTNVKELDFLGPVFYTTGGALDGNAPANKRYLTASVPVNIPDKAYVMLRWKDLDEFENDHGLAIDDFSMTWSTNKPNGPSILPVELANFTAQTTVNNEVKLNWATASEKNNSHFIVERSQNGKEFINVAIVKGKGTSATPSNYSFTDEQPLAGVAYYRLKQVDFDGSFTYSKVILVQVKSVAKTILYPTVTSDKLTLDVAGSGNEIMIFDLTGRRLHQERLPVQTRKHTLSVSQLGSGNYNLLIINSKGEKQVLRFLKR